MCITMQPAKLSNTLLYAGEAEVEGKKVHVLAYQNKVVSLENKANAMLIPFKAKTLMTESNIIDTSKFKNFLENIANATKIQFRSFRKNRESDDSIADILNKAKVFESGSYTIILADNVEQIKPALERVPTEKRPEISDTLLADYARLYPDQQVAVCCWNGRIAAEPLLWYYEPVDDTILFIPTMDSHDGVSIGKGYVKMDHIISTKGFEGAKHCMKVNYTDEIPAFVKNLLPEWSFGLKFNQLYRNSDSFIKPADTIATKYATLKRGSSYKDPDFEQKLTGWT